MIRIVFIWFFSFVCLAQAAPLKKENEKRFQISGGFHIVNFDYKEELPPPFRSQEKATFVVPSFEGLWFFRNLNQSFLKTEFDYSGTVTSDFEGTNKRGVAVEHENGHLFWRLETDFYFRTPLGVYLYAGAGFRYWNRFLSGGSGYTEIYSWTYFPVGLMYEYPFSEAVTAGVDFSYRLMSSGKIEVIFSETTTNGDDTTLSLGNRPGYKLQFPVKWKLPLATTGHQYLLKFIPSYEYSEIGQSDAKFNSTPSINSEIYEPASRTHQYGLLLLFGIEI